MPRLTIDNQAIEVPPGTTILQAAGMLGIDIPTLCHLQGQPALTSCFVCVVKVEGRANLLPSCATLAEEGMKVQASSPEVLAARRTCLELLLSDHVGDCIAPCQSICPAHLEIPAMLRHIIGGQADAATRLAFETLMMPATLGRICPAPCEKGCRRAAADSAISIRRMHGFLGDEARRQMRIPLPPQKSPRGKKVAIIGAGPAGLSAAYYLLQGGYACTIFDEHDFPGGMLRYAIDPQRLPREVVDAETTPIRKLGGSFRLGVRIGRGISMDDLRAQFDAAVVAIGQARPSQADSLGLDICATGIQVNRLTYQTSRAGVFAGGDAIRRSDHAGHAGANLRPTHTAVRSIADGRAIATSVHQYLSGQAVHGIARPFSCHIGPLQEGEIQRFLAETRIGERLEVRGEASPHRATGQPLTSNLSPSTSDLVSALGAEARRCLHCDCRKADNCRLRDHCQALEAQANRFRDHRRMFEQNAEHPQIIYESGKCIACGLCVQIAGAAGEKYGLTFIGRGFNVRVAAPLDKSLELGLQKVAAQCVKACPTGAMAFK